MAVSIMKLVDIAMTGSPVMGYSKANMSKSRKLQKILGEATMCVNACICLDDGWCTAS